MQAEKKKFAAKARKILKENGGDENDPAYVEAQGQSEYYDMLQGVRKVLLNSSYGATLNEFCRFFDSRLGASCTGTGRQITTFMINRVSQNLLGDSYPKVVKTVELNKKGDVEHLYTVDIPSDLGPIYGDTDSVYFKMSALVNNVDDAVACADAVVDEINSAFPEFMRKAFFCQPSFDLLIRANRELVASSSIFRAKKKYILKVVDKEGTRIPDGHKDEMYTKGSDIRLSSTPETIREFLKETTLMVLRDIDKATIDEFILNFRLNVKPENDEFNILEYASVASVSEVEKHQEVWIRIEKAGLGKVKGIPYGARAVIHHNECLKLYGDNDTIPITSGQKVKMIWLKPNELGYTNIAFSSDTDTTPSWFNEHFEPDLIATEHKLIDDKLKKIFGPIGWQIPTPQTVKAGKLLEF
jgi:DNA polymerase elongation subunit (family B)